MGENYPKGFKHLGGHEGKTHMDYGVLTFFKENLNVNTMIDIGCGPGGMVEAARNIGIDSYGVDGDFRLERKFPEKYFLHDFTKGRLQLDKTFDLAYSCEFVEHVYEDYQENYMVVFKKAKHVLLTFAPEGTPGHHHVNCKNESYWIAVFAQNGFKFDKNFTNEIRKYSTMERNFIRNNGLYFVNEIFHNKST